MRLSPSGFPCHTTHGAGGAVPTEVVSWLGDPWQSSGEQQVSGEATGTSRGHRRVSRAGIADQWLSFLGAGVRRRWGAPLPQQG